MEKQGFCKKKVKIVHHKSKTVSVKKGAGFVQYRHVNGLPKCRTERNGGAAMKERKRSLAAAAGGCVLLASLLAAGCAAGTETVPGPEEAPGITLTVCIAEAQWNEAVEELERMYLESHPEVADIQWELIRDSSYWDLMNMKLSTGNLPDIMEVEIGEELDQWYPHLIPLDDLPHLNQVFPDLLEAGKEDGQYYSVPQAVYGRGILYNMELLRKAGWERKPETRIELEQLCRDLEEVSVNPLMNSYYEISTWVKCGMLQMISMKQYPELYIRLLMRGNESPLETDTEWQELLDFCDLTLEYGTRRALQLDTDLARNYFAIGRYAMILNESARNLMGLREAGQGVDETASLGPMLLSDNRRENRLLMDVVRLGVTKSCSHPEEAKEFLDWLISDEQALEYQKQHMGIMPVMEEACRTGLCSMAQDTYYAYRTGRMTPELMGLLPEEAADAVSEDWARYIDGEISREELLAICEEYWNHYADLVTAAE